MEWVKLGDISIIHDGKRVPLNNTQRLEKSTNPIFPYYGANGVVDYIDDYIFDEELPILCIAEDGGSWGFKEDCSYIIREKCWVNNHAHVITVINDYNLNYINYYLNYSDINKYITGTTRGKLTQKELKNIVIPNLSLEIQNKIVNKLKTIEKLIQTCQNQIQALDDLVESVFLELFGDVRINNKEYPTKKWEDIITIVNGKNQKKVENENGKYPIYGSGGIMSYATDWLTEAFSVIIGRKGNINNPILVKEKFWNVDTAFGLEPNTEILNSYYLYYYCKLYNFERLNVAVTIPSLRKSDLNKIQMPLPPIEKQNQFAAFVEKIEKQKQILNESLGDLTNLFDSLMQDAFDGSMTK